LHPQKGFIDLLEAIRELVRGRRLWQIHLTILGTGPQEAELRAFIDRHELQPHVTLAGFRANPLPYFSRANLFCLPSLYEGMPNALVEAMVCRVPVLATDCPSGPGEVLDGGRYGRLVPPGDWRALAETIEDAIRRPEAWKTSVETARAHIEQTYSPVAGIARLEGLLSEIARPA
jgi:glycosyltransferase involved in cell wall biosynthesis